MNYQATLKPIFRRYPILFAYLFGSQARGKIGTLSDFDIAVFFKPTISYKERSKLRFEIKDDIEKILNTPDKVDVVSLNDAQPLLEREVVYKGKIIYNQDDCERAHYEAGAIGRWLDWKWYEDQYNKAIKKQFLKPVKPYV